MAKIHFQCPFCNRHITARRSDALAGFIHVECGAEIRISGSVGNPVASVVRNPDKPEVAVKLPSAKPFEVLSSKNGGGLLARPSSRRTRPSGKREILDEDKLDIWKKWREKFSTEVPWDYLSKASDIAFQRRLFAGLIAITVPSAIAICWFMFSQGEAEVATQNIIEAPALPPNLRSWDEAKRGVKTAVTGFFESVSWEEKLAFVCAPDRLKEQVRDYYENQNPPATTLKSFTKIVPLQLGDIPLYFVEFEDEAFRSHHVDVYEFGGEFRLNWESMVAYGTMPWSQFCNEQPTDSQQLRVYAMPVDTYFSELRDRKRFQSYRITHRSGAPDLYGYVERDSFSGYALRSLTRTSRAQPVYLSLSFPKNSVRTDCVDITAFIHNQWVELDSLTSEHLETVPKNGIREDFSSTGAIVEKESGTPSSKDK